MDPNQPNPQNTSEESSLEAPETVLEPTPGAAATASSTPATTDATGAAPAPAPAPAQNKGSFTQRLRRQLSRFNIYLLLFIIVILLGGAVVYFGYLKAKKESTSTTFTSQSLTQQTIDQLKNADAKVGDPQQTLSVQSNAVFAGKVLIRDSLDIAGVVHVSTPLSLSGLTVSGTTALDQIQANTLALGGNATIQGQLVVQKGITISGNGTFGGLISAPLVTTDSLQLNKDLQLNHHIDAGGNTPTKSDGSALGSGGTSSVSGTDTAGTVILSIGTSPAVGCFITVNFAQRFNDVPHIALTPIGSGAAGLNYYVTRTTAGFTVCSTNAANQGSSFSFDYIAID